MIFSALDEAAARGELILVEDGLCRYHPRKDGVLTIQEIIVLKDYRRKGIGRGIVTAIRTAFPDHVIRAKCPQPLTIANVFWKSIGFSVVRKEKTRKGGVVLVWEDDRK